MLEQMNRSSENNDDANTKNMTQLEGIRQKVFMDRYSVKDPDGNALEFYPEHLWQRVARGIASIETTPEKRAEWEKLFYEALKTIIISFGDRSIKFYNKRQFFSTMGIDR